MAIINFQRLLWGALAQPSLPAMKRRGLIYLGEGPVSAASSTVNIKVATALTMTTACSIATRILLALGYSITAGA
jgi:hypothetical protein